MLEQRSILPMLHLNCRLLSQSPRPPIHRRVNLKIPLTRGYQSYPRCCPTQGPAQRICLSVEPLYLPDGRMPSRQTTSKKSTIQILQRKSPMSLRRMSFQLKHHTEMHRCRSMPKMLRNYGPCRHQIALVFGHKVRTRELRQ